MQQQCFKFSSTLTHNVHLHSPSIQRVKILGRDNIPSRLPGLLHSSFNIHIHTVVCRRNKLPITASPTDEVLERVYLGRRVGVYRVKENPSQHSRDSSTRGLHRIISAFPHRLSLNSISISENHVAASPCPFPRLNLRSSVPGCESSRAGASSRVEGGRERNHVAVRENVSRAEVARWMRSGTAVYMSRSCYMGSWNPPQ